MLTRALAVDLRHDKILAIVMHPGWVQTDMGGPQALISAEESVKGIRHVIDELHERDTGKFFTWDGEKYPW